MKGKRPAIFRGRHFEPEIIATCVRWYLRFFLSLRNVEEMMAERGLMVDHTTVWRWCQSYDPMIYQRLRGKLKYTTTTCHMDETYVRIFSTATARKESLNVCGPGYTRTLGSAWPNPSRV